MFGLSYPDFWLVAVACVVLFGVAITVVAAQFVRSDPGETTK